MPAPDADQTGVYVLGMHRSGTSALTRAVDLLGVPVGDARLLASDESNPAGYWEPADLVVFNERLLTAMGGSWLAPPTVAALAEAHHDQSGRLEEARERFRALHAGPQWVWKDPRNCLLLGFWRAALGGRAVVVAMHREPAEVAASLARRGGFPGPFGVPLWERYLRAAVRLARGLPSLVVDYAALVADPHATVTTVAAFLESNGLRLAGEQGLARAAASIEPELWRQRGEGAGRAELSDEQAALAARLRLAAEQGAGLDAVDVGPETPTTERWLAMARANFPHGLRG